MKIFDKLIKTLPKSALMIVSIISLLSLAVAFFSEAFLGLEPCLLCIYQRIPYAVAFIACAAALRFTKRTPLALAISGMGFLINSGIATYHSGVERHWWNSAVDGCHVPPLGKTSASILENIMSAPTGKCSEIPWADPIFGLSMANYNIGLCLALGGLCLMGLLRKSA